MSKQPTFTVIEPFQPGERKMKKKKKNCLKEVDYILYKKHLFE